MPSRVWGGVVSIALMAAALGSACVSFASPKSRIFTAAISRHEDVLRLQIAMHDAFLVRRGEAMGDLHRVLDRFAHRQRAVNEPLPQRLAVE